MKVIVTHSSPDWDAITSVWLIKRFLPGWDKAEVRFVPAGERLQRLVSQHSASSSELYAKRSTLNAIERMGDDEVIHVDTGLGPLDHHQTMEDTVSAASLTFEFVKTQNVEFGSRGSERTQNKGEAVSRLVKVVVAIDHFKEVFWENATADYHEFSLFGVLEGLKLQKPNQDSLYVDVGLELLDATLHNFENRVWAEKEIAENSKTFTTKWGKAIAFESINDSVLKLAQKMGYVLVVRKDPRKGYIRIKARPDDTRGPVRSSFPASARSSLSSSDELRAVGSPPTSATPGSIDLTLVYEKLKKMDPEATWFLHVSKKMLLNGTVKNPKMVPTKLRLDEIIRVLENL